MHIRAPSHDISPGLSGSLRISPVVVRHLHDVSPGSSGTVSSEIPLGCLMRKTASIASAIEKHAHVYILHIWVY